MSPSLLESQVANFIDRVGTIFFTQAGLHFGREAWVAAQHGIITGVDEVCLSAPATYDSEAVKDGQVQLFEITEADQIGRKRGDEYRRKQEGVSPDPYHEVRARAEMAGAMLQAAIDKKTSKTYSPDVGLLVYLNLMEYGWFRETVEEQIYANAQEALQAFPVVDILWQQRVYRFKTKNEPPIVFEKGKDPSR